MIDDFNGQYRFLSNFSPSPFLWLSHRFGPHGVETVEHAYQAEKATDLEDFRWVIFAKSPGEAKRRGRQVTLRPDWTDVARPIMKRALGTKFRQNVDLGDQLRLTRGIQLVEGNTWHDQIWGDCRCGREACALPGANWLGELLMDLRYNWYVE